MPSGDWRGRFPCDHVSVSFRPARWAWAGLWLGLGVVLGGYLFTGVQPRSFLALPGCGSACYRPNDLAGLLVSIGVRRTPGLLPGVVKETERCLTIRHPFPENRVHFVVFPKRDIKDIGSFGVEDAPFLVECLAHIQALVNEHKLRAYRLTTNGPGRQDVTYLHFHLVSR
jgi:Scavenger mRNA decapping enzyme C-term binding